MPERKKAKMRILALVALILVLGLGGCASSGTSDSIIRDWDAYWKNPGGGDCWESTKRDWDAYWKNPGGGECWESTKRDWREFWN